MKLPKTSIWDFKKEQSAFRGPLVVSEKIFGQFPAAWYFSVDCCRAYIFLHNSLPGDQKDNRFLFSPFLLSYLGVTVFGKDFWEISNSHFSGIVQGFGKNQNHIFSRNKK